MEEVFVHVLDVDTVVVTLRRQDIASAVCGDAVWMEWMNSVSRGRTGVSEAEFAGRTDHHYCTGGTVSHTDI